MANFNKEFAAMVLLEALVTTDQKVCDKHGITRQTLHNYKKRLGKDPDFLLYFTNRKKVFDARWAETLPPMLRSAIATIHNIARKIEDDSTAWRNPQMLDALTNALSVAAEVQFTSVYIDAKLPAENRTPMELSGQEPAEAGSGASSLIH